MLDKGDIEKIPGWDDRLIWCRAIQSITHHYQQIDPGSALDIFIYLYYRFYEFILLLFQKITFEFLIRNA